MGKARGWIIGIIGLVLIGAGINWLLAKAGLQGIIVNVIDLVFAGVYLWWLWWLIVVFWLVVIVIC